MKLTAKFVSTKLPVYIWDVHGPSEFDGLGSVFDNELWLERRAFFAVLLQYASLSSVLSW